MTRLSSPSVPDPLPLRWAVILAAGVLIAMIVGGLTFLRTLDWPTTLLAAVGTGGTAIPALHRILGR